MVLSRAVQRRALIKAVVHLAAGAPLALMVSRTLWHPESLGANPIATLIDNLGLWALRLLLVTLALTPLRILTRSSAWLFYRRLLGLWAALYAMLHLVMYVAVDQRLDLPVLMEDVIKRPWITVGFAAILILLALTVTSTEAMRRRLRKNWQRLHNAVYVAAILGVWHYLWQVKKDLRPPLVYAAILAILFGIRLWKRRFKATSAPATVPGKT
jgi:sulfoxide reductase heme-binding subunit YedZ